MASFAVGGVEKIRVAPASLTGVVAPSDWKQVPKIAPGTAVFTKNVGTKTTIIPEDEDAAFVTFHQPGEGDTFVFGVLQQDPALVAMLFNVDQTPATSLTVYKAKEKIANLAIEITTRPFKDDRKCIITIYNTSVQTTYANNLTKDALQQLLVTATLSTYRTTGMTEDAVYTKQWVTAAGTPIDSTVAP